MNRGVELRSINRWLRRVGLVLVVTVETDLDKKMVTPTRLSIERARSYDQRARRSAESRHA